MSHPKRLTREYATVDATTAWWEHKGFVLREQATEEDAEGSSVRTRGGETMIRMSQRSPMRRCGQIINVYSGLLVMKMAYSELMDSLISSGIKIG